MKNIFKQIPKVKIPTAIKTFTRNIFALLTGVLPIALYILAIYFWQSLNIALTLNLTFTTFLIFALSFFMCGYFGTGKNSTDNSKSTIFLGILLWSGLYAAYNYYFGLLPNKICGISLAIAIFFALAGKLSANRLHEKQRINDQNTKSSGNLDIDETLPC